MTDGRLPDDERDDFSRRLMAARKAFEFGPWVWLGLVLVLLLLALSVASCASGGQTERLCDSRPASRPASRPSDTQTLDFKTWAVARLDELSAQFNVPRPALEVSSEKPVLHGLSYNVGYYDRDERKIVVRSVTAHGKPRPEEDMRRVLIHEFLHHLELCHGFEAYENHEGDFDRWMGVMGLYPRRSDK